MFLTSRNVPIKRVAAGSETGVVRLPERNSMCLDFSLVPGLQRKEHFELLTDVASSSSELHCYAQAS